MDKQNLRRHIKRQIASIDRALRGVYSDAICKVISQSGVWRRASSVLAFSPLNDEPDITPLIQSAEHAVFLPGVAGDDLRILPYDAELVRSSLGVSEPKGGREADPRDIDLVLVPGRAFSRDGQRLGRGGGYYDRFLGKNAHGAQTIGVAYSLQILDEIPTLEHDIAVRMIATEEGMFETGSGGSLKPE